MIDDFQVLLKEAMGLDASSIGASSIERAVEQRRVACGLRNAGDYLERVRASADEVQELIEEVIVPETWFFRDREAFAMLARVAGENWLRTHAGGVLRVLSLPCSTGEEPYSMAMALLDAGFPAERFRIDAVDISARSLAHARRAVYGRNSFRGADLAFRDRHFTAAGAGWQLAETVRRQVNFHQGNVLDGFLTTETKSYDVVFCRNLLIYFDRTTQDRAVATLTRLLSPTGWFFVGPAETGLLLDHGFVSTKVPLAFAFQLSGAIPAVRQATASVPPRRPQPARSTVPMQPMPFSSVTAVRRPEITVEPKAGLKVEIDRIMQLADQGRLVEAAKECEAHLRAQGPSAGVFYVMGLVRDASGNHAEAAEFYRKTLYLDPRHQEALVHLAFLLDRQGDKAGAKIMNERARRLEPKAVT